MYVNCNDINFDFIVPETSLTVLLFNENDDTELEIKRKTSPRLEIHAQSSGCLLGSMEKRISSNF